MKSALLLRSAWKTRAVLSIKRFPKRTLLLKGSWAGGSEVQSTATWAEATNRSVDDTYGKYSG